MKTNFGSLKRPVTITLSGEHGSGKAMLAGILSTKLQEMGAQVSIDVKTDNEKIATQKEDWIFNTKEAVARGFHEGTLHLTGKQVTIIIEE